MNILEIIKKLFALSDNTLLYITGGEALPKPLASDEERVMLERLPDPDAKTTLIERNLRLVVYIAKKFDKTGADAEDLISIGTVGLIKAINSFDLDKNIKLATYASRCIENEILMYLRRVTRLRAEVSLDEPLNVDGDGNELLMSDILGVEPKIVADVESDVEKQLLFGALSKLSSRERSIMQMRFGLDGEQELTQKEVAEFMGISQSYISRLEKKILFRLKKEMIKVI